MVAGGGNVPRERIRNFNFQTCIQVKNMDIGEVRKYLVQILIVTLFLVYFTAFSWCKCYWSTH